MKKKINQIISRKSYSSLFAKFFIVGAFLLFQLNASAQQRNISGSVTGADKAPLPGVTVAVKGTTLGTTTDMQGKFTLSITATAKTLMFSFVGMQTQEVEIGPTNEYNVVLKESTIGLEEVVVVGYGAQKKQSVVGAVAVVADKELLRRGGVENMAQVISGQIAGVTVMERTGEPGREDPTILIRGMSSWNASQPLILVDGIERRMSDIDVNEVANVSVLKDASATAVFGVKGANGVILITTKRGEKGKATLSLTANKGWKMVSKIPSLMRAYEAQSWKDEGIRNELSSNETTWQYFIPNEIVLRSKQPIAEEYKWIYPDVNWRKELFKTSAPSSTYNLSLSGGTDFARYFASVAYLHEGDLFNNNYNYEKNYDPRYTYDRFNFRGNLDLDLTKTTTLSSNLSGYLGTKNVSQADYSWTYAYMLFQSYYYTAPDSFISKYPDGRYGYDPTNQYYTNPLVIGNEGGRRVTNRRQISSDTKLTQKLDFITEGLSAAANISYDTYIISNGPSIVDYGNPGAARFKHIYPSILDARTKQDSLNAIIYAAPYPGAGNLGVRDFDNMLPPWYTQNESVSTSELERALFYQVSVNYARRFGQHEVSGLMLFNRRVNATGPIFASYREDWVGRLTYNYDNRYFAEFNGAYNGSEKFGPNYRFGFFPSMALGWMVTNEEFMKQFTWLSKFKIRGSIGQVGSDAGIPRWGYLSSWTYIGTGETSASWLTDASGTPIQSPYKTYMEGTISNSEIRWEVALKKDIGAEIDILNRLFTLNIDFWQDNRSDVYITSTSRNMPNYFGASPVAANLGATETKGYELEFGINKTLGNGIDIYIKEAISHAKDKVTKYEDPQLLSSYQKTAGFAISQTRTQERDGFMNNWDDVYASVPAESNMQWRFPGAWNIVDFNGDGIINTYDNNPYGFAGRPQNTYSTEIGCSYKGLSFMAQLYGVNNITLSNFWSTGPTPTILGTQVCTDRSDYWTPSNTDAYYMAPRFITSTSSGDWTLMDGSYLRLKTVELSYTLPPKSLRFAGVSNCRIYITGNNLFLWNHTEADFETSGVTAYNSYPMYKVIHLGIDIKF